MSERHDHRPKFKPNTDPWVPNTVEEQKEDHDRYYDQQHDIDLADKLSDALRLRTVEVLRGSMAARKALVEIVQELRLTTY